MSLQQALSGLNASNRELDAIGNNVSNARTVGFKQAELKFGDVFAASVAGTGNGGIGIGTQVGDVAQLFTQGNLTVSSNPLDMAINGDGFFRVSDGGQTLYTRNGQFQLDKNSYIVNSNGNRLTGYPVGPNGQITTSAPVDLQVSAADLPPTVTTETNIGLNLDSRKPVIAAAFNPNDSTTYTSSTSLSTYDSLGNAHTLTTYFAKSAAGTWNVYGALDGSTSAVSPSPLGTLHFDSSGAIDTTTTTLPFTVNGTLTNGAVSPFTFSLDLTGSTQFGTNFSVNNLTQDGYTSGRLNGFSVSNDGTVLARYSNGQTRPQGQIVLASFINPQGLAPLGNNNFAETADSGPPLVGAPNTGNLGVIQAGAVEESNVDLTAELVKMITAQRVYQANAQTIKTQDQVLQTLVNIR